MFAVLLFMSAALILGGSSIYVIRCPEDVKRHTIGSLIELIYERMDSPWDRYFIRGGGMIGLAMSGGFLLMALFVLF